MTISSTSDHFPAGFYVDGVRAGFYPNPKKLDAALFYSDAPAEAAAVFTQNQVVAAPVKISRERIFSGRKIRAILANSGCANACTGQAGERAAKDSAELLAQELHISADEVLLASTGVIGVVLNLKRLQPAIATLANNTNHTPRTANAAAAIMTTDTRPKVASVTVRFGKQSFRIWGTSKGSGMIHPNMATLLAFLLTDADVPRALLQSALKSAVAVSFNSLSIDGDTSTNDSVFLLANGASGVKIRSAKERQMFLSALSDLCLELARQMASDGEGATRRVEVTVSHARTAEEARAIAATIATSPLVKTAVFGHDANWGRVMAAAGRAGVAFDPKRAKLYFGKICVFTQGQPARYSESRAKKELLKKVVAIHLDLGHSNASGFWRYFTCDFSYDYVKINASYRS